VGIRRAWNEDLYLIMAGIDDANGFLQGTNPQPLTTFRVLVNPLVPWIWLGGLIMAIGTLIALWPAPAVAVQRTAPARPAKERDEEMVGV